MILVGSNVFQNPCCGSQGSLQQKLQKNEIGQLMSAHPLG